MINRTKKTFKILRPIIKLMEKIRTTPELIYYPQLSLVFIHIPKTGGTSIKKALNKFSHRYEWIWHIPKDVTFLAVNRNDNDRLLSGYNYTIKQRKDIRQRFNIKDDTNYPRFLGDLLKIKEKDRDIHFQKTKTYLDRIGVKAKDITWLSFDNLENDFNMFCKENEIKADKLERLNVT